jgi:hypothetical protein
VQVSIGQFYGIEINGFAVAVAQTALWIAESQMLRETEDVLQVELDFLPLKRYANVVEGNALRLDWRELAPPDGFSFIIGNPPFVGYSNQSAEQKADILSVYVDERGKPYKTAGKIDYVAGWYFKAAELMAVESERGVATRTAFVSTNSIVQGEQVAAVWKPLRERFNVEIEFARRTFRWDVESSDKAHVHCVIVGFKASLSPETSNWGGGAKWRVLKTAPRRNEFSTATAWKSFKTSTRTSSTAQTCWSKAEIKASATFRRWFTATSRSTAAL